MGNMYALLLLSLVLIRFLAGYDSRYQKEKSFVIKNPVLRRILVDEWSFWEKTRRRKKDINRICISGVLLYVFALIVMAANLVLMGFVPKIPIEPWGIDTERFSICVNTLNAKLSAILIGLLLLAVMLYLTFSCVLNIRTIKERWIKILVYSVVSLQFFVTVVCAVYLIQELIGTLVG